MIARVLAVFACLLVWPAIAWAGLSAENVVVVVNGQSESSKTIANHYIALRDIPASNVIVLDKVPVTMKVTLAQFKETILSPLLAEIDSRKLASQTRVIAYSAGFPTAVTIPEHTAKLTDASLKQIQTPTASINSLTFFFRFILADSHEYLGWGANLYARGPFARCFDSPLAGDFGTQFTEAKKLFDEAKFGDAGKAYAELAKKLPSVPALNVRAGESFIKNNQRAEAMQQVALAIRNGWTNRRYLTADSELRTLFSPADLKSIDTPAERTTLGKMLAPTEDVPAKWQGPIGFAGDVGWSMSGYPVPIDQGGMSYLLSCCLAVVEPLGSTPGQAIEHLKFTATGDATFPTASVGFAKTNDVRSTTRLAAFTDAIVWLLANDRATEIFSSTTPTTPTKYVGLMLGAPDFSIRDRQWTLVPGSIADNLTSFGGAFDINSQTKLTELLHAGASMSSGAVAEPYAIPMKFPGPMMHPYYAEGVTAVEAFYLACPSPYQLLIVGDPLAAAFVRKPSEQATIELIDASSDEQREVTIKLATPAIVAPNAARQSPVGSVEIYLMNRLVQRIRPVETMNLRLPGNFFGALDVRVTLVGQHVTQPRSTFHRTFLFGKESLLPTVVSSPVAGKPDVIAVALHCNGAERIELMHLGRVIGEVAGTDGTIELTRSQTGVGPLRLQAIGRRGEQQLTGPFVVVER